HPPLGSEHEAAVPHDRAKRLDELGSQRRDSRECTAPSGIPTARRADQPGEITLGPSDETTAPSGGFAAAIRSWGVAGGSAPSGARRPSDGGRSPRSSRQP